MVFTNAYILGIQRRSDYFGERTANYRSVDTISIEGYIDVRGQNTDQKGVRQAIQQIDNYVAAASNSASVVEAITINETGYGTGRIVSLDFPASSAVDEDQIRIGKYTASIEVYNSGYLRDTFEGASIPYPQFLESFSEDFSYGVEEDNTYNLSHSLSIQYLSGVKEDGSALDPISTAKTLAETLFAQTPSQFSTVIDNSYGSISVASRKYTNESYNLIDGSCDFDRNLVLLPSGASTYSVKISNSFSFDEGGIVKVSEDGDIEPRSPEFLDQAIAALDIEIGNSFDRCNVVYSAYKNYLGTNGGTLNNRAVSTSKKIDNNSAKSNYSVEYTDDKAFKNLTFLEERTISIDESDNITTVEEDGTITSVNFKGTDFNPYSLIPSRSDVKARCQDFYTLNDKTNTLKNESNKFTIPKYGKEISYTYSFTDDPDVFDRDVDATFARKKITVDDNIGIPVQSAVIIPNVSDQILHTPGQTSLGSRSVKMDAQLRRTQFTSNIDTRPTHLAAIASAQTTLLGQAYLVYAENNQIVSTPFGGNLAGDKLYINTANYSFGSDNTFNMSLGATFKMLRNGTFDTNLVFNP